MDSVQLREARDAAIPLVERGFIKLADGRWAGTLTVGGIGVEVNVTFPEEFPNCVPEIRIDRQKLPRRIPHVEHDGKLCLIPNTGVLIDSSRPRDIVAESLTRAEILLQEGLSGDNKADFIEEFLAYWNPVCDSGAITSTCTVSPPSREICILHYRSVSGKDAILACDSLEAGKGWLARVLATCIREERGWLHFLNTSFPPPDFGERLLTGRFADSVKAHSTDGDWGAFSAWLSTHRLPCVAVYCMLPAAGERPLVFAVRYNMAAGKNRLDALKGFRECSLPPLREFAHTSCQPITRFSVDRLDWEFLLPRAGGSLDLKNKTVVVVGCGSVGSLLADKLACLGIGTLRLIDVESLDSANVHRHALGVDDLGKNKASALSSALGRRFPHITTEHKAMRVQAVLRDEPDYVLSADLVCIALGDETTELWLNDYLGNQIRRLHTWVEPLGIGGHVLLTGMQDAEGCYRCLFKRDEVGRLYNAASFAKEGQTFTRSFAGCAGGFTPFACLDADRTALEAARCSLEVLVGEQRKPLLLSWYGHPAAFTGAGFICSKRSFLFAHGQVTRVQDFVSGMCQCREWTKTA